MIALKKVKSCDVLFTKHICFPISIVSLLNFGLKYQSKLIIIFFFGITMWSLMGCVQGTSNSQMKNVQFYHFERGFN